MKGKNLLLHMEVFFFYISFKLLYTIKAGVLGDLHTVLIYNTRFLAEIYCVNMRMAV